MVSAAASVRARVCPRRIALVSVGAYIAAYGVRKMAPATRALVPDTKLYFVLTGTQLHSVKNVLLTSKEGAKVLSDADIDKIADRARDLRPDRLLGHDGRLGLDQEDHPRGAREESAHVHRLGRHAPDRAPGRVPRGRRRGLHRRGRLRLRRNAAEDARRRGLARGAQLLVQARRRGDPQRLPPAAHAGRDGRAPAPAVRRRQGVHPRAREGLRAAGPAPLPGAQRALVPHDLDAGLPLPLQLLRQHGLPGDRQEVRHDPPDAGRLHHRRGRSGHPRTPAHQHGRLRRRLHGGAADPGAQGVLREVARARGHPLLRRGRDPLVRQPREDGDPARGGHESHAHGHPVAAATRCSSSSSARTSRA